MALASIGDIEYRLLSPNPIVQSQGFSNLVSVLKTAKEHYEKKNGLCLLWKCLNEGSELVISCVISLLPELLSDGSLSKEEVIRECIMALNHSQNISFIVQFLLDIAEDITECVLTILRHISKDNIDQLLAQIKLVPFQRCFPCIMRVILGEEISKEYKRDLMCFVVYKEDINKSDILIEFANILPIDLLGKAKDSAIRNMQLINKAESFSMETLKSVRLDYDSNLMELCERLSRGSLSHSLLLISNETLPSHPSLISPLSTIYACLSEFSRNNNMPRIYGDSQEIVKQAMNRAKAGKVSIKDLECGYDCSLSEYLAWIYDSDITLNAFLKTWLRKDKKMTTIRSLNFISGLLPKVSVENLDLFLQLYTAFADANFPLVNEIFFAVLSLYGNAALPKQSVLECMAKLATRRSVVGSVLKLLLVIANQRSNPLRLKAIELVGDVWSHNENLMDAISILTTVDTKNGDLDLEHAKMRLISRICLESDCAVDFLPRLSELSNCEGPLLPDAIHAIAQLCRAELLDVSAVLKQLENKITNSNNILAVVEFCELLRTSVLDPEEEEVQLECIRKLWELKKHSSNKVKAAAWKALSAFELNTVKNALNIDEKPLFSNWIMQINWKDARFSDEHVVKELGCFLHKMVAGELDELGRALYTTNTDNTGKLNELIEMASDLRETLTKSPGIVQLRMLATMSSSLRVPTKRSSSTMQLFYRLLIQMSPPTENDWKSVMDYMSAWKMGVGAAFEIICKAKQTNPGREPPKNWARDQLCETMKRALSQDKKAQINVLVAIIFLAEKTEWDRPWATSVFEFLLLCCNRQYEPRSQPVFQHEICYKEEWRGIIGLATALFSSKLDSETLSFVGDVKAGILNGLTPGAALYQWTESLICDTDKQGFDEVVANVSSYLIRFTAIDMEMVDGFCSRSEVTCMGYILGADETMIACLVDQMRLDVGAEQLFVMLINQTDLDTNQIQGLFESYSNMSSQSRQKFAPGLVKRAEKEVKKCGEDTGKAISIVEGLSWCNLCAKALHEASFPTQYKALAEESVLKCIVGALDGGNFSSKKESNMVKSLLKCLVDQRRKSDERVLPPLDWTFLYEYCGEKWIDIEHLIIHLSIQQKAYKIFCRILSKHRSKALSLESAKIISENLATLQCNLSTFQMRFIIELLFETASTNESCSYIFEQLAKLASSNTSVVEVWCKNIPKIKKASDIEHPLFASFLDLDIPRYLYSCDLMLSVWTLSKYGGKLDLRNMVQTLSMISEEKRSTAYLICAYNFERMSLEERLAVMLQLVSLARVDGHFAKEGFVHWMLFVALCNTDESYEIPPVYFSENDDVTWQYAKIRVCDHFRALVNVQKFGEEVSKISYLFMDILLANETDGIQMEHNMKETIKKLLRISLAKDTQGMIVGLEQSKLWTFVFN